MYIKILKSKFINFNLFIIFIAGVFFAFIILVLLTLVINTSLKEFLYHLYSPVVFSAILISLETSIVVVCLSFLFGFPVAYLLALKNFKGKIFLDTLLDLPIVLPPLVSGLALLLLFGGDSWLGNILNHWNISIIFTKKGIIIAQLFVSSPFFIKTLKEAIVSIPKNLLYASATLGASSFYTFKSVILPLCKRGVWAGLVMTWARAMGEFGATAMVAGCIPKQTETMTIAIYMQAMSGDLASATSIALILMILSFISLFIFKRRLKYEYYS